MENLVTSPELLNLLNKSISREMQVSIQYMLQHSTWNARLPATAGQTSAKQSKFVGSHSAVWLPGNSLKKIAITEMRHAEAVAERVVRLGGEPTTQPDPVIIGETLKEILEIDREQERGAIDLYREIIEVAEKAKDESTRDLFKRILSDEELHHRVFSRLLEEG